MDGIEAISRKFNPSTTFNDALLREISLLREVQAERYAAKVRIDKEIADNTAKIVGLERVVETFVQHPETISIVQTTAEDLFLASLPTPRMSVEPEVTLETVQAAMTDEERHAAEQTGAPYAIITHNSDNDPDFEEVEGSFNDTPVNEYEPIPLKTDDGASDHLSNVPVNGVEDMHEDFLKPEPQAEPRAPTAEEIFDKPVEDDRADHRSGDADAARRAAIFDAVPEKIRTKVWKCIENAVGMSTSGQFNAARRAEQVKITVEELDAGLAAFEARRYIALETPSDPKYRKLRLLKR